jgi:hypothetical protein
MKKILFALSTVAILASCSQNNPRPAAETQTITPTDTAGLAQFQAWKAQNELAVANQLAAEQEPVREVVRERVVYVTEPRRTTSTSRSTATRRSSGSTAGVLVHQVAAAHQAPAELQPRKKKAGVKLPKAPL